MIHRFETVESTNETLARMAEEGAADLTAVVADRQTGGKGREGRRWWSPPGNLHLSILLRPRIPARFLPRVSILAAVALFRSLDDDSGRFTLKWPNDLLLDGRKAAGILPAARTEGEKVHWVVTGFGVNMVRPETGIPVDLDGRIAFVRDVVRFGRDELAQRILGEFTALSCSFDDEAWEGAREAWSRSAALNGSYTLREGGRRVEGTPVGLAGDGGLIMETSAGTVTVYAGELKRKI